jgi:APA family basic amino acid/polyamine antiporter
MTDIDEGKMGIWMTSALVVGTIIGAAIFMLPVALAPLGINALVGWLVSGIGIICIAFSMAQLSRLGGDGIQANIERELGPTPAFLTAWAFWFSNWVAQASVAVAIGSTMSFIVPALAGPEHILQVGIGCVVFLTVVNAIGVRASGGLSIVTVAIKLLPLLAVIWLFLERGVTGVDYEPLAATPIGFTSIATATALTFFALTGFEGATAPVCKVRDPSRTIPRAILGGTAFVALLYLFAGSSIQFLMPASAIVNSPAPFADAMVSHWGNGVASFAALAIAVSAFGCLNGLILATGELGYAMALRGDLPGGLARTRGANTPIVSQLVASGLTILLLLANTSRSTVSLYTFIVLLSAAGGIVLYFISSLAAWRSTQSIRARSVIVVALLFAAYAAYGTGLEASMWCTVLLAAGLAIRAAVRRLNSREPNLATEAVSAAPPE